MVSLHLLRLCRVERCSLSVCCPLMDMVLKFIAQLELPTPTSDSTIDVHHYTSQVDSKASGFLGPPHNIALVHCVEYANHTWPRHLAPIRHDFNQLALRLDFLHLHVSSCIHVTFHVLRTPAPLMSPTLMPGLCLCFSGMKIRTAISCNKDD